MKNPYIIEFAIPFWLLAPLLVKNETVNGIIGNTQGVSKAINPPKNPNKKIVPGQSQLHYSPGIPLRMNIKKPKINEAFILIKKRKIKSVNYYDLSKKNDLKKAAKNLYMCLRKIKNKGYKSISVEKITNKGLGRAINDRLIRASKYKN